MNQNYEFPRVTTRGYYDLHTGKRLNNNNYNLYPKKKFNKIFKAEEVVIFVHGMRNSRWGAQNSGKILRRTIRKLGYNRKYPVISFTYDADIRGAHIDRNYHKVIRVANKIAKANGRHLGKFIKDLKESNPNIKIHLVGHSLGCNVVDNVREFVESIHLLGSPIEVDYVKTIGLFANKVTNYYNPKDAVIQEDVDKGYLHKPSCLNRVDWINVKSKRIRAIHHGFSAYAKGLRKFP